MPVAVPSVSGDACLLDGRHEPKPAVVARLGKHSVGWLVQNQDLLFPHSLESDAVNGDVPRGPILGFRRRSVSRLCDRERGACSAALTPTGPRLRSCDPGTSFLPVCLRH